MKYQASVVVCTYNSDIKKTIQTLFSIVRQRGIEFEVVIADDGSLNDDSEKYKIFFQKHGFKNYKLVMNPVNRGTVENLYSGLSVAEGEYFYGIAPGDLLYDRDVLKGMYEFAQEKGSPFVFGDTRYYHAEKKRLRFFPTDCPKLPKLFNISKSCYPLSVIAFLVENNPVGASYFRKTDLFLEYLNVIRGRIRFVEDMPTLAMYLLDGNYVRYYNRPVVWYEFGTGISTTKNEGFLKLLKDDETVAEQVLIERYPRSRIVKAKCMKSLKERLKYLDICAYSILFLVVARTKYFFRRVPESDHEEIKKILRQEEE